MLLVHGAKLHFLVAFVDLFLLEVLDVRLEVDSAASPRANWLDPFEIACRPQRRVPPRRCDIDITCTHPHLRAFLFEELDLLQLGCSGL